MADKPKFGIVDYSAKKQLQITCSQYLYLYAISQMDGLEKFDFWCIATNDYFADMLDMSVRGVQKMNKVLIDKGLIRKGKGSQKRATDKFKSTLLEANKVHPQHEQSSPYNNKIRIDDKDNNKKTKKKPPIYFQDSDIGEEVEFLKYFQGLEKFKDFDLIHYFKKVDMWGSTNKRINWKKVAQNFMVNDNNPKAKVIQLNSQQHKANYFTGRN